MELAIGTPALNFTAIVDTGSDLIWTQCQPCVKCFPQPSPLYNPSKSSTFSKIQCNSTLCQALPRSSCSQDCKYLYTYGDGSSTQGYLATETFTFGSTSPVSVPGIGFGCGTQNIGTTDNSSGLVGLGRGALSLVSQLGISKFSYCFTSFGDPTTSPLLLGSLANFSGAATKSTKFVKNPTADPMSSFYYLSLQGITVGKKLLSIPPSVFQLNQHGSGGLIIDSGTTITALEEMAFIPFMLAFRSQVNLSVADGSSLGLKLCFSVPAGLTAVEIPKVIFHFDGADMELPPENLMVEDPTARLLCLFMVGTRGMSIFGNFQQQNMHILYDLDKEVLKFEPTQCNKL
ncbi:aspartic proteinase nepenthesin-1-like [Typha angustifolia]|uniref:aspartic proteinase nepenthesin-1-like n=1 Tax=Typha angustifolia TaxID=59011 RepID=UPI003C2C8E57